MTNVRYAMKIILNSLSELAQQRQNPSPPSMRKNDKDKIFTGTRLGFECASVSFMSSPRCHQVMMMITIKENSNNNDIIISNNNDNNDNDDNSNNNNGDNDDYQVPHFARRRRQVYQRPARGKNIQLFIKLFNCL